MKKISVIFFICLLALGGCGVVKNIGTRTIEFDTEVRTDPTISYAKYKRYTVVPFDKENPLVEKRLLLSILESLNKRGFIYDDKKPDFFVMVGFGETKEEKHYRARVNLYTNKVMRPGGVKTVTRRFLELYLFDAHGNADSPPIWRCVSEIKYVEGPENDRFDKYGPFVIDEMLDEFPSETDKGTSRRIRIKSELID